MNSTLTLDADASALFSPAEAEAEHIFIRRASEFPELASAVALLGDRPIIFKRLVNMGGYADHTEFISPAGEIVIAQSRLDGPEPRAGLQRTFVHEVAHLLLHEIEEFGHGLAFGAVFYSLLSRLGWQALFDYSYDIQDDTWLEHIDRVDFVFTFANRHGDGDPCAIALMAKELAAVAFENDREELERDERKAKRKALQVERMQMLLALGGMMLLVLLGTVVAVMVPF